MTGLGSRFFCCPMTKKEKIAELLKKKLEVEEKVRGRLKRFRGVAHESASGELAYSDLKVWEDYLNSINEELANLQKKD